MKGRVSGRRYASKQVDVCTDCCSRELSLVRTVEVMIVLITLSTIDPICLDLVVRACFERFRLNTDTSAISSVLEVMNASMSLKAFASTAVSTLATGFSVHGQSTDWHQSNSFPAAEDLDRCLM